MTFNVPESNSIDLEELKRQINDLVNVILSRPSVLKKEVHASWTEEFRGKWQDDNMTAEEFVRELREHRSHRNTIDKSGIEKGLEVIKNGNVFNAEESADLVKQITIYEKLCGSISQEKLNQLAETDERVSHLIS